MQPITPPVATPTTLPLPVGNAIAAVAQGAAFAAITTPSSPLAAHAEDIARLLGAATPDEFAHALQQTAARFAPTAEEARAVIETPREVPTPEAETVTEIVKSMGIDAIKETAIATELGRYNPITVASIEAVADALHMSGYDVFREVRYASTSSRLNRFKESVVTPQHESIYDANEQIEWMRKQRFIYAVTPEVEKCRDEKIVQLLSAYETVGIEEIIKVAEQVYELPGFLLARIVMARHRSPMWWQRVRIVVSEIECDPRWPSFEKEAEEARFGDLHAGVGVLASSVKKSVARKVASSNASGSRPDRFVTRNREGKPVTEEEIVTALRAAHKQSEAAAALKMASSKLGVVIRCALEGSPIAEFQGKFKQGRQRAGKKADANS